MCALARKGVGEEGMSAAEMVCAEITHILGQAAQVLLNTSKCQAGCGRQMCRGREYLCKRGNTGTDIGARLVIGEDAKGVQIHIRGKAGAVAVAAGDDPRHEAAVPQPVLQGGLVGPVGPLPARRRPHTFT